MIDKRELPPIASVSRWASIGIASRETLRRAIERGELRAARPTKRTIRVLRTDLMDWLRAHAVEAERQKRDVHEHPFERGGAS